MQAMEDNKSTEDDDGDLSTCIEHCFWSHEAATRCISHCLGRGGAHAGPAHIRLLMDCAEITQTAANFMLRGSDHDHFACGVCGKICEHCADACEAMDPEDEHMAHCAEACRRCADSCHEMVAQQAVAKVGSSSH